MDILGEGAGWSSFTVRERGEKGTQVRDPRNMTLKHVFYRGGGGNGFIAEKTILFQGSRGGPTFSGEVHPRGDPNANCYHNNL